MKVLMDEDGDVYHLACIPESDRSDMTEVEADDSEEHCSECWRALIDDVIAADDAASEASEASEEDDEE